ncbi:MAG: hypothetical protein U0457_17960 [Candidatus Sericytochromatia bacterium]
MNESEFTINLLIILLSPVFVTMMFQLSSYLNKSFLSTGIALMEIEDFAELTGIKEENIRMFPLSGEKVKFKVLNENKEYISEAVFDLEMYKILEKTNIEIDQQKFLELKKIKFAQVFRLSPDLITISNDGLTFTKILNGKMEGEVVFSDDGEVLKSEGFFKKYF